MANERVLMTSTRLYSGKVIQSPFRGDRLRLELEHACHSCILSGTYRASGDGLPISF